MSLYKEEYYEKQQFRQWWLWTLLTGATFGTIVFLATAVYTQLYQGIPFGENPASDHELILATAFFAAVLVVVNVLIYKATLEVKIDRHGIWYRYFPLIPGWRYIDKNEIKSWAVKKYIPTGYGMRFGLAFTTLNVSGRTGLELDLYQRRNLRIGTRRPDEMKKAMEKLLNRTQ
jgi:hypothetical protein